MKRIATALLFFALSACALFQPPADCTDRGDGLCWKVNPSQIPVTSYAWQADSPDNATTRCGYAMPFENASCVMWRTSGGVCLVVSALTESQARVTLAADGLRGRGSRSIFQHEMDHCGLNPERVAYLHTDATSRPLLP